jgi:hypothetical protein
MRFSAGELTVARAVFQWAVINRLIGIAEHRVLVLDVLRRERMLNGCGKVGFVTFALAKAMAKARRGKDGHKRRTAYRCDVCQLYHLGDASFSRNRRRMKERARA